MDPGLCLFLSRRINRQPMHLARSTQASSDLFIESVRLVVERHGADDECHRRQWTPTSSGPAAVCVECLFFKDTGVQPVAVSRVRAVQKFVDNFVHAAGPHSEPRVGPVYAPRPAPPSAGHPTGTGDEGQLLDNLRRRESRRSISTTKDEMGIPLPPRRNPLMRPSRCWTPL